MTAPDARRHADARDRTRLVYVIGTYPLVTTTFIDREIHALQRRGIDVRVLAIRRPDPGAMLSADQRALQRSVTYLLPVRWRALLAAHALFALRRPRRYLTTLLRLLTRRHPGPRAWVKTVLHFGEGVYAAHLLRHVGFRELHAHFADRAATVALVAGRLLGKPYSLSIHAGADIYVAPTLLAEKVAAARGVVTCTVHNRRHLARCIGPALAGRISVVPHGLDLDAYVPAPHPAEGDPLILAVGQLQERKGFADLLRACATLRDRGHRFRCVIVGAGPQSGGLEDLVAGLSLAGVVTLAGPLPHEQVVTLYGRAAMFVLPCLRTHRGDVDGIPNVLAEAMALEVPVVSTDLPAIRELVTDRVDGLLVPPQDHEALVTAMACLLADPPLAATLGHAGRRTVVDTFDVEANVRRFAAALWPDLLPSPTSTTQGVRP